MPYRRQFTGLLALAAGVLLLLILMPMELLSQLHYSATSPKMM